MKPGEHTAAVITGLAAVLAAGVTAWWSGTATRDVVRESGRQQETRRNEDARGAARVLAAELLTSADEMVDLAGDAYFRPFDAGYAIDIPRDDLRLIAANLSSREWARVTLAISDIEGLRRYVRLRSGSKSPLSSLALSHHALGLIARDMNHVGAAITALTDLGQLRDTTYPQLDVAAAWKREVDALHAQGLFAPRD